MKRKEKQMARILRQELEKIRSIVKPKTQYKSDSEESQGRRLRYHRRRRHLKHYTEANPRFGRLSDGVGSFVVDTHWAGSLQEGISLTDYHIKIDHPERHDRQQLSKIAQKS